MRVGRVNEVDYISAYGPGHPVLDAVEIEIIKRSFRRRARFVPVNSIKGVTGNALGCGRTVSDRGLRSRDAGQSDPADSELRDVPDPECDLDVVAEPRSQRPNQLRADQRAWHRRQREHDRRRARATSSMNAADDSDTHRADGAGRARPGGVSGEPGGARSNQCFLLLSLAVAASGWAASTSRLAPSTSRRRSVLHSAARRRQAS